tara:strand:+ start:478 stop:630 length:153 start_codon:yes stop_codon:yes gene_type:complete
MKNTSNPINNKELLLNNETKDQFASRGLYVKEDDQDWGSSGMNDIQKESE